MCGRSPIRQAPVALSIIDLAGHQLAGNEAYAALFGYSLEEMQALEVSQLTHPDGPGPYRRLPGPPDEG